MDVSNWDVTLLAFLEAIDASSEVPDGCDIEAIVTQGLATCEGTRCTLTPAGRERLRELRIALRDDDRPGE
jgi:hypothetical protein